MFGEAPDPGEPVGSIPTSDFTIPTSDVNMLDFETGMGSRRSALLASQTAYVQSILSSSQESLRLYTQAPVSEASILQDQGPELSGAASVIFEEEEGDEDSFSGFSVSPPHNVQGDIRKEMEQFRSQIRTQMLNQQRRALRNQQTQFSATRSKTSTTFTIGSVASCRSPLSG